jgi:release factor glutamine methyltransferase
MDRDHVIRILADAGCVAPGAEADEFIRAAAGDEAILERSLARRTAGEPVAWITGSTTFCGQTVSVAPGVYVPRPQTEALALRAVELLPPRGVAVDLCTGSGAIALVLALSRPGAHVVATELDPTAAACARRNGVVVFEGSLDEPLPRDLEGCVDVLTAVVPYVPTDGLRLLPSDVLLYEPRLALDGGIEGTALLREVVRRSPRWLRPGGRLLLELGGDQLDTVGSLLRDYGFDAVEEMRDAEGDVRAVRARVTSSPAADDNDEGWLARLDSNQD